MPRGKAADSLVEDVQQNLPLLHLHDERDRYETVLWRLAAKAEKDMGHLPIVPVDQDSGHSTGCATFAGQDNHVPFYFDRPVTRVIWINEATDKQLCSAVIVIAVIGGNLHGIVLPGPPYGANAAARSVQCCRS
jgi:hypothetical protein